MKVADNSLIVSFSTFSHLTFEWKVRKNLANRNKSTMKMFEPPGEVLNDRDAIIDMETKQFTNRLSSDLI